MYRVFNYLVLLIFSLAFFNNCSKSNSIVDIPSGGDVEIIPLDNTAEWIWQNPRPQDNHLNDVEIINEKEIIAVGDMGAIIKSNDGGESWYSLNISISSPIYNVEFINSSTGIIATFEGVFKTSDGGLSWEKINDDILEEIQFLDESIGFGRISGLLKKTNDGGVTWTTILEKPNGTTFTDLYFYNNQMGWVATLFSGIYYTIDGGKNWKHNTINKSIKSIYFKSDKVGFFGTEATGELYKTIDGGINWSNILFKVYNTFSGIEFSNSSFGWTHSSNGIFITKDGGKNWNEYKIGNFMYDNYIKSVAFTNETLAFAVGTYGILSKSSNQGITWESIKTNIVDTYTNLNDVVFKDPSNGIIIGSDGIFLRTTDGGSVWKLSNINVSVNLNKFSFVDSKTGFICGDNGTLLKTTDFGINWSILESNTTKNILSCFAISEENIWIAGDDGLLSNTQDGGMTWTNVRLDINNMNSFYDIYFINNKYGLVVSEYNQNFKTSDGGQTWESCRIGYDDLLRSKSIYMKSELDYFIATDQGLYRTSDGGENWDRIMIENINEINFSSKMVGWCTSNNGVYLTTNGGNDWVEYPITSYSIKLNSTFFIDGTTGWIVGDRGTIVKSNFK